MKKLCSPTDGRSSAGEMDGYGMGMSMGMGIICPCLDGKARRLSTTFLDGKQTDILCAHTDIRHLPEKEGRLRWGEGEESSIPLMRLHRDNSEGIGVPYLVSDGLI